MLAFAPITDTFVATGTGFGVISAIQSMLGVGLTTAGTGTTVATGAAGMTQTVVSTLWKYLKSMAMFAKTQATTFMSASAGMTRQAVIEARNSARNMQNTIRDEAKNLFREGTALSKFYKTMKFIYKILNKLWPIFKWIWIFTILMNNIGVWAFRTIEVIIYRIFHFKDCFLWYVLEIIGYILYVPFEFFIWLLCMKPGEKAFWKMVDNIDCFFKDMTGFHIFHYSDAVLKKCYSVKIPPFPYDKIPFNSGEFTKEAFIKFLVDWFMPPGPAEISQAMRNAANLAKESAPVIKEAAEIVGDEIAGIFKIKPPNKNDTNNELKKETGDITSI